MARRKLFLVDDEPEILDFYHAVLAPNFDLEGFDSPTAMIAALEGGTVPDVFITDMKMPGMNGIELIQWARKNGFDHPFIMISGYAERSEAAEAMKLGLVELLEKPIMIDHLKLMVQRSVRNRISQEIRKIVSASATQLVPIVDPKIAKDVLARLVELTNEYDKT